MIILADAWKTVPNMTLLLLAGLQPISADLYEAAGSMGHALAEVHPITLPLLRPAILVSVALRISCVPSLRHYLCAHRQRWSS